MNFVAFAVVALLAGIGLAFASRASAATEPKPEGGPVLLSLDAVCRDAAKRFQLDALLLLAICEVESARMVSAVRWNPPNDVSVGAMQILCTPPHGWNPARDGDYVCQNHLPALPDDVWPSTFYALQNPAINVDIGARILADNIRLYGLRRGVAVYNDFAARHAGPNGPFPNDGYVTKVFSHYDALKRKEQAA